MGIQLTAGQEAALLAAARCVPDERRQQFFDHAADELKRLLHVDLDDVRAAIQRARIRCECNPGGNSGNNG